MRKNMDKSLFNILGYGTVIILSTLCVLPFLLIISGSLSENSTIVRTGFAIWPKDFSFEAYITCFKNPEQILNAYKITIIVTLCGTFFMLAICSMAGYVLSRKDYKYRNAISFFFFFTTIFSGGLVPWYILCVQYLDFKDYPMIALIIPGLFSYFYIIIMRTSMAGIPDSIGESAKIDGANDFTIFVRLILPLSKPVLATIGLFGALNFWNDWFNAMLFITNDDYFPLQYFLYKTLNTMNALNNISANINIEIKDLPTETFKLAMTIVATGPVIMLYPFLQKYFIKGMTVGAVKG